jgi:hypothetical protein
VVVNVVVAVAVAGVITVGHGHGHDDGHDHDDDHHPTLRLGARHDPGKANPSDRVCVFHRLVAGLG